MSSEPKPLDPEIVAEAKQLAADGANRETVLGFLRRKGFDKIDSTRAIRTLYGVQFEEAKQLVHTSDAWSDRFQCDEDFHKVAERAFLDIASSNDPDLPKFKP